MCTIEYLDRKIRFYEQVLGELSKINVDEMEESVLEGSPDQNYKHSYGFGYMCGNLRGIVIKAKTALKIANEHP